MDCIFFYRLPYYKLKNFLYNKITQDDDYGSQKKRLTNSEPMKSLRRLPNRPQLEKLFHALRANSSSALTL